MYIKWHIISAKRGRRVLPQSCINLGTHRVTRVAIAVPVTLFKPTSLSGLDVNSHAFWHSLLVT